MSATSTVSAGEVALMASSIITRQYGQPVATTPAPVAKASRARSTLTRWPSASSIHMRAPPAPQQELDLPERSISKRAASGSAYLTWLVDDAVVAPEAARIIEGD